MTDPSKPDGTPKKLVDSTLLRNTDWRPEVTLEVGLERAYADYLKAKAAGSLRSV